MIKFGQKNLDLKSINLFKESLEDNLKKTISDQIDKKHKELGKIKKYNINKLVNFHMKFES